MNRLAWMGALVVVLGCPADDDTMEDGSGTANPTDPTDPTDAMSATDSMSATESADGSSGDNSAELGCAAEIDHDTTDGASEDLMQTWGAPCTTDEQCVELLGEGGVCLDAAVIYELPGGYCSKMCELDAGETYRFDDPTCDAAGGIDCMGQTPLLQVCAPQCTDDNQCTRGGYTCRNLPMLASEGDPTYCLMPDCCQDTCAEG